ncbi:hypothetical protein Afil01_64550 [Actinorhabdospora filicis]|uniref:Uncharacterized protein n=1 Tax=Actinorhabdospora filicis TaxID=1785913 RepID=A0A9W6SSQ2_9ACTN|nr:hypothetical protein [Actinorhabdospora filicis]GLZ81648.1 hypothetical protein Afil01_64550 [Actinorhabdospora filicis]
MRARVWPPVGARPREDAHSEPSVTEPVRVAILAAQRTVGNRGVTATVQRLLDADGKSIPVKTQSYEFLLEMMRVSKRAPGKFTVEGKPYTVEARDIPIAEKVLGEEQSKAWRKIKGKSPYGGYADYAASLEKWREKHTKRPDTPMTVGQPLYHGTTRAVALEVKSKGLIPADPKFRGKRWDASKDGYLSMATTTGGVTLPPGPIVLRMVVAAGDGAVWHWKAVGGSDEVVTMVGIPAARLEWIVPTGAWKAPSAKWKAMADLE